MFVRKWLSKEELAAERILRDKCNKLNDANGRIQSGHKPYVIIDGQVRERRNDTGRINYNKSINIDLLLAEPAAEVTNPIHTN